MDRPSLNDSTRRHPGHQRRSTDQYLVEELVYVELGHLDRHLPAFERHLRRAHLHAEAAVVADYRRRIQRIASALDGDAVTARRSG
jgi:hypothetical protein